jgi:hypothetical protein
LQKLSRALLVVALAAFCKQRHSGTTPLLRFLVTDRTLHQETTSQATISGALPTAFAMGAAPQESADPGVLLACPDREGPGRSHHGDELQLGDGLSRVRFRARIQMTGDLLEKSLNLADALVHVRFIQRWSRFPEPVNQPRNLTPSD